MFRLSWFIVGMFVGVLQPLPRLRGSRRTHCPHRPFGRHRLPSDGAGQVKAKAAPRRSVSPRCAIWHSLNRSIFCHFGM